VKRITVKDLARWRREGKNFVLLDVREAYEVSAAALPESTWIPMREIAGRLAELPADKPIAVICHHGGRSQYVAQFLAARGFTDVANVDGGIDAYARTVDPSVPRY
jgi:rhodanese-related sulfurtransferase